MFLNDFVNRNARCVAATEYTPNAAPQRYYLDVNNSVNHSNVTLSTLPVGKTFLFEAYPNTYPGKWYRFELDSLSEKGYICPWVSETGRFLINSDEDTLCFSVIPGSTKVYVHNGHTDAMRASFSGSDTSEEREYEHTEQTDALRSSWGSIPSGTFSLRSDDLMSWASNSARVIDELIVKVESQDRKLDEIAVQLKCLIDFSENMSKNFHQP